MLPVSYTHLPKILLVAPIHVGKNVAKVKPYTNLRNSHEESLNLDREYSRIARERGVAYLNAAHYAEPSKEDGVHMDPENHEKLGIAIAGKLREMLETA